MENLHIISATRGAADMFTRGTKLGTSLPKLLYDSRITASIACGNTEGLPTIYNRAIQQCGDDETLLFIHDDVFINDFNLFHRIEEALRSFDVVGVAGTARADAHHVGWMFWRNNGEKQLQRYEKEAFSGAVGHFTPQGEILDIFGPSPRECVLLDGCFLAAHARELKQRKLFFDERFSFHFYDLDFCRTCSRGKMRLGTWPIAVTHASVGLFGTAEWEASLEVYQGKWAADPSKF